MDIYAQDFSLDAALKENCAETVETIAKAIAKEVEAVDAAIKKGLAPNDFAKAKELRAALMAAFTIISLRKQNESK